MDSGAIDGGDTPLLSKNISFMWELEGGNWYSSVVPIRHGAVQRGSTEGWGSGWGDAGMGLNI